MWDIDQFSLDRVPALGCASEPLSLSLTPSLHTGVSSLTRSHTAALIPHPHHMPSQSEGCAFA